MTRKDYVIIADAIRALVTTHHDKWILSRTLSDSFSEDNPHFDRERFLVGCGLRETSSVSDYEPFVNDRLIAAAPDLLEACKAIIPLLDSDLDAVSNWQDEADMVRNAIAKAGNLVD